MLEIIFLKKNQINITLYIYFAENQRERKKKEELK